MNDTESLRYDDLNAIAFAVRECGHAEADVQRVLETRDLYLVCKGIMPADDVEADVPALRERYGLDVTPGADGMRRVTWEEEAGFVVGETHLPPRVVTDVLAADSTYQVARGIEDQGADAAYRAWAVHWAKDGAQQHQSGVEPN